MSVDRDTLNAVITSSVEDKPRAPATPFLAQMGIVETLRAVFAEVEPIRQSGLLLQLTTLAKSNGFSKDSFLSALNYLREGQRYGVPPSEYGLKALMREKME